MESIDDRERCAFWLVSNLPSTPLSTKALHMRGEGLSSLKRGQIPTEKMFNLCCKVHREGATPTWELVKEDTYRSHDTCIRARYRRKY
jgi:hypothetical protein